MSRIRLNTNFYILSVWTLLLANNAFSSEDPDLGGAFDTLSGSVQRSCLDMGNVLSTESMLNETNTEFFLAHSRLELAKELGVEINAEVSTSFGAFSSSLSSLTKVLNSADFSENSLVVIYRFRYKYAERFLKYDRLSISPDNTDLLLSDARKFRYQCGDGYIDSVNVGAELYLVFNLRHKNNHDLNKLHTRNAVKAAFGSFFKTSIDSKVDKKEERILNSLDISIDCVAVGLPKESCVVPIGNVTNQVDVGAIAEYLKLSNAELLKASIEDYVPISFSFQPYYPPNNRVDASYYDTFFDISPYRELLNQLMKAEQKVDRHCDQWVDNEYCEQARVKLHELIQSCAEQARWSDCSTSDNLDLSFLDLLPALEYYRPGKVTLVSDRKNNKIPSNTRKILLDFNNENKFPGEKGFLEYDTLYLLSDFNFPINKATAYYSELSSDYRLCIYSDFSLKHFWSIGAFDGRWYNFTWMNDDADYFRLVKDGEYASGC